MAEFGTRRDGRVYRKPGYLSSRNVMRDAYVEVTDKIGELDERNGTSVYSRAVLGSPAFRRKIRDRILIADFDPDTGKVKDVDELANALWSEGFEY